MKRCSTLLANKEMHIKTTMRYHYTAIRMPKKKKSNANEDREKLIAYCWCKCKMVQPLWKIGLVVF